VKKGERKGWSFFLSKAFLDSKMLHATGRRKWNKGPKNSHDIYMTHFFFQRGNSKGSLFIWLLINKGNPPIPIQLFPFPFQKLRPIVNKRFLQRSIQSLHIWTFLCYRGLSKDPVDHNLLTGLRNKGLYTRIWSNWEMGQEWLGLEDISCRPLRIKFRSILV